MSMKSDTFAEVLSAVVLVLPVYLYSCMLRSESERCETKEVPHSPGSNSRAPQDYKVYLITVMKFLTRPAVISVFYQHASIVVVCSISSTFRQPMLLVFYAGRPCLTLTVLQKSASSDPKSRITCLRLPCGGIVG